MKKQINELRAYTIVNDIELEQILPSCNWYMTEAVSLAIANGIITQERIRKILDTNFFDEFAINKKTNWYANDKWFFEDSNEEFDNKIMICKTTCDRHYLMFTFEASRFRELLYKRSKKEVII